MTTNGDMSVGPDEREDRGVGGLRQLRSEVLETPAGRAAYEDAKRRNAMLATMAAARKAQGLSQTYVAQEMGTTQSAVSQIESGRVDPQLRTLQRYARAINLRLDVALVHDDLPSYDEGMANALWRVVERMAVSPLLTALATNADEQRTVDALASAARLPSELVPPILRSLEERGWVSSSAANGTTAYNLRDDAAYTIGLSVDHELVVGVLLNLRGDEISHCTARLEHTDWHTVIGTMTDVAAQLHAARGEREVLGVGVSVAGIVDQSGTVALAPDLVSAGSKWENVDLEGDFEEALQLRVGDADLRVVVENDANSLAVHEYLRTGDQCVVSVLLNASGIGVGAVVDGNVVHGEDHAAGEAGHIIVDPDGEPCRSGDHHGCLETVVSAHGILRRLGVETDSLEEGLAVVNYNATRRHPEVLQALHAAGRTLGELLATMMMLYDPSHVAIFGHRALVDAGQASAARFHEGIRDGLVGGLLKDALMVGRLHWKVLGPRTQAAAAGSAAMHFFLKFPDRWRPSVLDSRTLDAVRA